MNSNSIQSLILIVPLVLFFYFLILKPQKKQKNEKILLIKNLKKGDNIITYSGIHGIISKITEKSRTISVKISNNVEIIMEKEAVFKNLDQEKRYLKEKDKKNS